MNNMTQDEWERFIIESITRFRYARYNIFYIRKVAIYLHRTAKHDAEMPTDYIDQIRELMLFQEMTEATSEIVTTEDDVHEF